MVSALRRSPVLLLFLMPSLLQAQDLLTLDEAVRIALENNPAVARARNDVALAENSRGAGAAGWLPTLDAVAGINGSVNNTDQEYVSGETINRTGASSITYSAGIGANWLAFDGFRRSAVSDRLDRQKELSEANLEAVRETLKADIARVYYDVVRQQNLLAVLQDAVTLTEERVRISDTRYDVGEGTRLELLQAQADLSADRSARLRQQVELSNARVELNRLMARPLNTNFSVIDTIEVASPPSYEDARRRAIENNSRLQAARLNKAIADLRIAEVRADYWPKLNLNLGYNFARSESEAGFVVSNQNTGVNYGVTASLNLFNGGNTARATENARIAVVGSELTLQELEQEIEANIAMLIASYRNRLDILALEQENIEVARLNMSLMVERLRVGVIRPLELREAQQTLVAAENRLFEALYEAKLLEIELDRVTGE